MLPYHLERYDPLLNEAFAWVRLPEIKAGAATAFWIYYSNTGPSATPVGDSKATYDADTMLVYHFGERNLPPTDSTKYNHTADQAAPGVEGAAIGGGIRLSAAPVTIPANPTLDWVAGSEATLSMWIKLTALPPDAVILSRRDGDRGLTIGANAGVPFVEIADNAGTTRSSPGFPLNVNAWHNLALVAEAAKLTLYLDGEVYGTVDKGLPPLSAPILIGGASQPVSWMNSKFPASPTLPG